jgi:hypothetical protein
MCDVYIGKLLAWVMKKVIVALWRDVFLVNGFGEVKVG